VTVRQQLNACSQAQITAFITACASSTATMPTCQTWFQDSTNATCAGCIEPSNGGTPTNTGATLTDAGGTSFNVPGCVALTDATNGPACAVALAPLSECGDAACSDCLQSTTATSAELQQCYQTAEGTGGACATYYSTAASSCAIEYPADGGGAGGSCNNVTFIVNKICGSG
jgi:hypothetical protein